MYRSDISAAIDKSLAIIGLGLGFALLLFLVLTAVGVVTRRPIPQIPYLCLVAFIFGILALVIGLITAASRTAAEGDVLPAVLGFIGAVALYVITKSEKMIPVAATAVSSFSILLLLGTVLGSYERARGTAYAESQRFDIRQLIAQANAELAVNGYRVQKGLKPINFSK